MQQVSSYFPEDIAMKKTRNLILAALIVPALVLTTGCSVARKQESIGQYVDGTAVTAEVKAKLLNASLYYGSTINVKTIDGGIVQLSGFAKSDQEKERAGQIANSVKGVTQVHNDLIIRP